MKLKCKSFSLVELMVVIAIIGILSAIAVPSYKNYVIKSNIAAAIPVGEYAINYLINSYENTGSFPSSISVYGANIPSGGGTLSSLTPVTSKLQISYANFTCGSGPCAIIGIYFSTNLGIAGYSFVPGNANAGQYNRICMGVVYTNSDIYKKYCGGCSYDRNPNGNDITSQYLPPGCNTSLDIPMGF